LQEGLAEKLPAGEVPRRIREAPFVQIPLGVTEDRLVGTVDIEASMKARKQNIFFWQKFNLTCTT
jgi:magnesium chelatase subunit D